MRTERVRINGESHRIARTRCGLSLRAEGAELEGERNARSLAVSIGRLEVEGSVSFAPDLAEAVAAVLDVPLPALTAAPSYTLAGRDGATVLLGLRLLRWSSREAAQRALQELRSRVSGLGDSEVTGRLESDVDAALAAAFGADLSPREREALAPLDPDRNELTEVVAFHRLMVEPDEDARRVVAELIATWGARSLLRSLLTPSDLCAVAQRRLERAETSADQRAAWRQEVARLRDAARGFEQARMSAAST